MFAYLPVGFWKPEFYHTGHGLDYSVFYTGQKESGKGGSTMTTIQSVITILVVVLGTMLTRFLPFLVFPEGKTPPPYIAYLGTVLPYAVIGLLVIYCFKDVSLTAAPHGLPEGIAVLAVAGAHLWKRNMLLSIGVGTVLYMLLVQLVF